MYSLSAKNPQSKHSEDSLTNCFDVVVMHFNKAYVYNKVRIYTVRLLGALGT
jgi:hypothetical protein